MHRLFESSTTLLILVAGLLTGCPYGDVGAPCSHGKIEPVPTRRVTFPALSCNDLLCIYAEADRQLPGPDVHCDDDDDCNPGGMQGNVCDDGTCKIGIEHVLEYSMCSKPCVSDDDCRNTGRSSKKRPVAEETACEGSFVCARIQKLGEFCCKSMCVCDTYLGAPDEALNDACIAEEIDCEAQDGPQPSTDSDEWGDE